MKRSKPAPKPKLIKKKDGPGLNLPRKLFLLDGRQLDKVEDFRFRENTFKLQVFKPLNAVDAKNKFVSPNKQFQACLARTKELENQVRSELNQLHTQYNMETKVRCIIREIEMQVDNGKKLDNALVRNVVAKWASV